MSSRKAFVFSIDAFVAFTLCMVALYSLVFFSGIPHTYYTNLMQANDLSKDVLTTFMDTPSPKEGQSTLLGYLVLGGNSEVAKGYLKELVPPQFGYSLEISNDGENFNPVPGVNTYEEKEYKKLKAISYALLFDFTSPIISSNPFGYNTCSGTGKPCTMSSHYEKGEFNVVIVRLIIYA